MRKLLLILLCLFPLIMSAQWQQRILKKSGTDIVPVNANDTLKMNAKITGGTATLKSATIEAGTGTWTDVSGLDTIKSLLPSAYSRLANVYRNVGGGKAVLVLRFDDVDSNAYTIVYPALKTRNLVGTFAINSSLIGSNHSMTVAQIFEIANYGNEIAAHSRNHITSTTLSSYIFETVGDKFALESLSVSSKRLDISYLMGWGGWTSSPYWIGNPRDLNRVQGQVLSPHFAGISILGTSTSFTEHIYSTPLVYPVTAATSGDALTVTQLMTQLRAALRNGQHLELLIHPVYINSGGSYISTTNFQAFLDSVVVYQAKGLSVMTATAALYAQPNITGTNICYDGDITLAPTDGWYIWYPMSGTPSISDSGRTGTCLHTDLHNQIGQYFSVDGSRSIRFTGYARTDSAGSANAYLAIGYSDGASGISAKTTAVNNTTWTKIEYVFQVLRKNDIAHWYFSLGGTTDDGILWDDISITRQ